MLVLASQSPRRRELLQNAGIPFRVFATALEERVFEGESPQQVTMRLAREKAEAAFALLKEKQSPLVVLGADTVVSVEGEILGKPRDAEDAARMLRLLSGKTHSVTTGVCVLSEEATEVASETTQVQFATLTEEEISAYVATGEPMDKAGAYAIQGMASRWVTRISGCYFNVVGLPVTLVAAMIEGMGDRERALNPALSESPAVAQQSKN